MNLRITAEKEERYYMSAMPAQNNNPNDIKIRKFRDTLVTGGFAIIAFGIWTVIKSIMETFTILQPLIGRLSYENLSQLQAKQLKAMIEDNSTDTLNCMNATLSGSSTAIYSCPERLSTYHCSFWSQIITPEPS